MATLGYIDAVDSSLHRINFEGTGMIVVLGSIDLDISMLVQRLRNPGETILAHHYLAAPEGKGAYQACVAPKAGAGGFHCQTKDVNTGRLLLTL